MRLIDRFRPTVGWALLLAGVVAGVAVTVLPDPDHIVTVASSYILAALALGKDIVQADRDQEDGGQ